MLFHRLAHDGTKSRRVQVMDGRVAPEPKRGAMRRRKDASERVASFVMMYH